MANYVLEEYHHRVFGAVASLKAQFLRPEWHRIQEMNKYTQLPPAEQKKAMAEANGALPAAADVQAPRSEDSDALLRADALRWLAYRTQRNGGDEGRALRELIQYWATELHKSLESMDFPDKWRLSKAGQLFSEIEQTGAEMIREESFKCAHCSTVNKDYPGATFPNAMKIWLRLYDMHEEMDKLLAEAVGGAKRPVLTI